MKGITMNTLYCVRIRFRLVGDHDGLLIQGIPDDYLPDPHDVLVLSGHHQRHDFPQAGDRESLLLLLELQLLESIYPARFVAFRPKHDAIRALFDMI